MVETIAGIALAPPEPENKGSTSAAVKLIEIGSELVLFPSTEGAAHAVLPLPSGGTRTVPLASSAFKGWLAREYHARSEGTKAASSEALSAACNVLAAKALDAPAEEVFVRVGEHGGALYLDLADETGAAVKMTSDGWTVTRAHPVRFIWGRGRLPLPVPVRGGTLEELRPLINAPGDDEWRLLVAWLVAAMRPGRPLPVLVLRGEAGSAKSTTGRLLRALVDPASPADRARPRDERDLAIAARNSWVIAFDNLSGVQDWLSDALCRLATGAGFATRTLYADGDETVFSALRPLLLNGIDDVLTRGDLADRAVLVSMPVIPEDRRRTAEEVERAFKAAHPRILGALCDVVCAALRELPDVSKRPAPLPRMADFGRWVTAAEVALGWEPGAFTDAYSRNRGELVEQSLEADPVARLVRRMLDARVDPIWTGTAGDLLDALNRLHADGDGRPKPPPAGWPATAHAMANRLRRAAPHLRAVGVEVEGPFREGHDRRRLYRLHANVRNVRNVRSPSESHADDAADDPDRTSANVRTSNGANGWNHCAADNADDADDDLLNSRGERRDDRLLLGR